MRGKKLGRNIDGTQKQREKSNVWLELVSRGSAKQCCRLRGTSP